MVKNIFDKPQEGDKLYQQRARKALPLLVRQATAGNPIRYEDLALELGMLNPRNLDYVLGCIGETLIILSEDSEIEIPPIQCLVINKTTGLPGEGFGKPVSEIEDLSNYKQLSNKKRKDKIDKYLESVYSFDKWKEEVLDKLGLSETKSDPDLAESYKKIARKGRGGGEGEEHKKLKEYVANNPAEFGLPKSTKPGKQEHSLPSGDSLDVFFIIQRQGHIEEHIGVEVKSHISGTADVLRGVYQCVKYQAVLEAKQVADGEAPNVRTFLVLGGKFPKELMPTKNTLGIEVYDEKNKDIVNISV